MKTVEEIKEIIFNKVELALLEHDLLAHNVEVIKLMCIGYAPKQAAELVKQARTDVARRMLTKHRVMIDTYRKEVTELYFENGIEASDPLKGVFLDTDTRKDLIVSGCTKEDITARLEKVRPKVVDQMFAALESGEEKVTTVISIYNQLSKMTGQEVELEEDIVPEEKPDTKADWSTKFKFKEVNINDL